MPQDQQTQQTPTYTASAGSSPLFMQSVGKSGTSPSSPVIPPSVVADSSTNSNLPINSTLSEPSVANSQINDPVTNTTEVQNLVSPIVEPVVAQPIQTTPVASVDPVSESVPANLNVESIISEISEDLNNNLNPGKVVNESVQPTQDTAPVTEAPVDVQLTQPVVDSAKVSSEPAKNLVTYNVNAQDTFQENYQKEIEISNPVKIDSNAEGVKEIKPIEDNIPSQIVGEINASKDLQYKNYNLDEILKEAIKRKASDVHFTQGYRATFRIDGELRTFNSQLLTGQNIKDFAKEMLKHRQDVDIETIKEFDLTYTLEDKRFRVNIFKQLGVYSIVCRVINETILSLDSLGLPPVLSSLTKFPNGLVIVTGPTGSGKSTTLASLLNSINLSSSKHIVTLEDPVEYVLPKGLSIVDQREFGTDFMSWPNALKSVLRQDPNIVLVGEMRDLESIEAALQVAETGHLVFATLHTNSAAQSIDRIIDVFPAERQAQIRLQLASVIRAVTSQRLIPMATGGRIPVVELVIANTAVQNAIREGKVFLIDNVIQTSAEEGMISLEKSLVQMVKEGKLSTQTAKSYSLKPNEIDMLLNK